MDASILIPISGALFAVALAVILQRVYSRRKTVKAMDFLESELNSTGFGELLESKQKITREYEAMLSSLKPGLKDARTLPYEKDDIDNSVWVSILTDEDDSRVERHVLAYKALSEFQVMTENEIEAALYLGHVLSLRDLPINSSSILKMSEAKHLLEPIRMMADQEAIGRELKLQTLRLKS